MGTDIWTIFWRALRALFLLCFLFLFMCITSLAVNDQQWDKAIFFLIIMIVISRALDKIYEKNKINGSEKSKRRTK